MSSVLELAKSLGVATLVSAIEDALDEVEELPPPAPVKRARDEDEPSAEDQPASPAVPAKRNKIGLPLLHSILTQLPLHPQLPYQPQLPLHPLPLQPQPPEREEEEGGTGPEGWASFLGEAEAGEVNSTAQNQLVSLLSAAAKLKQVADRAMRKFSIFACTEQTC